MKVYVDESPAGSGKTYRALENATRKACKCLFITERKKSFAELENDARQAAQRMGTSPIIRTIHADDENLGNSVVTEIAGLPKFYVDTNHVIVIATHAALLRSDFERFKGWQVIIDEVPGFLDFEEKVTHLDEPYFQRHYKLDELSQPWHAVTLTDAGKALSVADVRADQSHSHLCVFHARVTEASRDDANRHVLCNLPKWEAMKNRKVKWCWASAFSLRQLEAFDRVELLGNRFLQNIGPVVTQWFDGDGVEWISLPPLAQTRRFAHRKVHIHYFSERPSARTFFETAPGQQALKTIGGFLAGVLPSGNSIWSANDVAERGKPTVKQLLALPDGDYLTPKQAGTNRYQSISHAAMIYAAKPSPNLLSLLKALGIDSRIWTKSIEHEAILQFMTRTSVRDPNNATPVHLWVFDRDQALYLKAYFDGLMHVTATVSHVPLSLGIPPKQTGGRPRHSRTPQEELAHRAELRRRDALRKARKRAERAARQINK